MWFTYASSISLVATVISAVLVYLILKANIKKPGNLAAFVMFLGVLIWSFGELLERIAGPPPTDETLAYLGALTLCVGIFLTPAGLIHFAIDYPYRIKMKASTRKYILYAVYILSFVGIAFIPFNSLLGNIVIKGVSPYNALGITIWGLESSVLHKFFATWDFIAALIMIGILIMKLKGVDMYIIKNQIIITLIGFLIMFFMVVFTSFVPTMMNINMYPLNTLAFSIFGLFVIYTVHRYRLFLVAPVQEEAVESEEMPDMGIYEMKKDEAYHKFMLLVKSGNTGVAFISENAEDFKKKYGLKNTSIYEISKDGGKNRLNPENKEHMEMIGFIITSLLEQVYKPVILLDLSEHWLKEETRKTLKEKIQNISSVYGGVYLLVE